MNLIDLCKILHPTTTENTFLLAAHGTSSKIPKWGVEIQDGD
jgi:hypothetical protein